MKHLVPQRLIIFSLEDQVFLDVLLGRLGILRRLLLASVVVLPLNDGSLPLVLVFDMECTNVGNHPKNPIAF